MLSYDGPGKTVVVTGAEVQAAIITLRNQNLKWVYNARSIRDNDFFDISTTEEVNPCTCLVGLI
jgi:hypothetical protein